MHILHTPNVKEERQPTKGDSDAIRVLHRIVKSTYLINQDLGELVSNSAVATGEYLLSLAISQAESHGVCGIKVLPAVGIVLQ